MPSGLLIGLVFVPSMLFAYVMLTTFYGVNRAYIAISWVPLAFVLTIWIFMQAMQFQHLSDQWWRELAGTIRWTGVFQAGLGIGLAVRRLWRNENAFAVLLATFLPLSPFFVRFAN